MLCHLCEMCLIIAQAHTTVQYVLLNSMNNGTGMLPKEQWNSVVNIIVMFSNYSTFMLMQHF